VQAQERKFSLTGRRRYFVLGHRPPEGQKSRLDLFSWAKDALKLIKVVKSPKAAIAVACMNGRHRLVFLSRRLGW
jgi:hypothetical protein